MSPNPSISVVIPAFNSAETLGRALDSVLAQSVQPVEIIVVDDHSSDDTGDVARSYEKDGAIVLRMARNCGAGAARNAGIWAAKGDWIGFLDADDEWLPEKLERQAAAILSAPKSSFAFCASDEFSSDGKLLGDTFRGEPVRCDSLAWKALLACNFVATPTVLAPRDLLVELGGFDTTLKIAEDQDMWIRLALRGAPVYVVESLARIHIRSQSLSSWDLAAQRSYTLPMIERHLARLAGCLTRSEVRAIKGTRLSKIGAIAFGHGDRAAGLAMIFRAVILGYRPIRNILLIGKLPLAASARRCARLASFRRYNLDKNQACVR